MSERINDVVINHYKNMSVSRQMFDVTSDPSGIGIDCGETVVHNVNSGFEYNVNTAASGTILWKDMPYYDCVYGNIQLAQTMVAIEDDYILGKVFAAAGNAHITVMNFGISGNAFYKINNCAGLLALDGYNLRQGTNLAINRKEYTRLVASRGVGEQTGDEMMNVMALLRGGRIFPANVDEGCGILSPIAEYSGVMYTIKRDWQLDKHCDGYRLSLALGDVSIEEPNMIVRLEGM